MLQKQDIIYIDGEVGRLETLYLPPSPSFLEHNQSRGVAIINHPNPTQGGTFTNKVIQTAAKCLNQMGFHCYLPNLRGTGNSDGVHDYGRGETQDCLAVIDYALSQHTQNPQNIDLNNQNNFKLVIGGFSFGGYVATFAAQQRQPDLLLLIGAAVGHYAEPAPYVPDITKTLLIHGANDEVVELAKPLKWAGEQNLPVVVLPECSHFFHGKLIFLRDTINQFVPPILDLN